MRFLGTLAVVVVFVGMAVADVPPPPVPKGKKRVGVEIEVLLAKDVTGYVFVYAISDDSGPAPVTPRRGPPDPSEPKTKYIYKKVELSDTKPFQVRNGRVHLYPNLYAIPEDVAKKYKTDEELCEALDKGQIKGWIGFGPYPGAEVSDKVNGDKVTWTYTITGIDSKKKEITTTIKGEGYEPPAKVPAEKKGGKQPLALTEPRYLIGGIALALSVTFGGVWLVWRRRTG